jgi:hypothetical protein
MNLNKFRLSGNKKDLVSDFHAIAEDLMQNHILVTKKQSYFLAEIEFYYYHDSFHPDNSTHCHPRQLDSETWYVHRYGKTDTIIKTRRKGIDITFGNGEDAYGGILLRALQNIQKKDDYVYGTSKILDRIIGDSGSSIEQIEGQSIFENNNLSLLRVKSNNMEVFNCPRHGLGKTTTPEFINLGYRFFILPDNTHKGKEKVIIPYLIERVGKENTLKVFNRKTFNDNKHE